MKAKPKRWTGERYASAWAFMRPDGLLKRMYNGIPYLTSSHTDAMLQIASGIDALVPVRVRVTIEPVPPRRKAKPRRGTQGGR